MLHRSSRSTNQSQDVELAASHERILLAAICTTAKDGSAIRTTLIRSSINNPNDNDNDNGGAMTRMDQALKQIQPYSSSSTTKIPTLSDFAPPSTPPIELPLSASLQQTLFHAGQLSATMNGMMSTTISTSTSSTVPATSSSNSRTKCFT